MAKISEKLENASVESITTTIEIARKLEKENKFFVHPHPSGATFGVREKGVLRVDDKEQTSEIFSDNLGIIHHVAFHILLGTEEEIKNQVNMEIIDIIRDKYIDEAFKEKFYIGTTSKSNLFTEIDFDVGTKLAISEMAIVPPVPYLTLWINLIESSEGDRKRISIEMDNRTFLLFVKQVNEINDKVKKFIKE